MTNPITLDEMESMSQAELGDAIDAGRVNTAALGAERSRRNQITQEVTNAIRTRLRAGASIQDAIAATEAEESPFAT